MTRYVASMTRYVASMTRYVASMLIVGKLNTAVDVDAINCKIMVIGLMDKVVLYCDLLSFIKLILIRFKNFDKYFNKILVIIF